MKNKIEPKKIKLKGMRLTIARRMHESLTTTAQLTMHSSIEISELVTFKNNYRAFSYTDLFIKATAMALMEHPRLNSTLIDNIINQWPTVHMGMAVALDEGLIVPTIMHAEKSSLAKITEQRKDLVERAQKEQLTVEEITSSTFTISNLGMYPVDAFTPILNPPQVGLLGIGRIQTLPRFSEEVMRAVPIVHLSLTIDHRAVDGAQGAKLLKSLEKILQNPDKLLS